MATVLGKSLGPAGLPSDGVQLRDNLWTTAQMPAVTVEVAYLSNLAEANLLKKSSTLDAIAGAMVKGMEAQDPALKNRAGEIAAYARAHHAQRLAATEAVSASTARNPAWPWAPVALVTVGVGVFRRRLIPVLALVVAILGLALGPFHPEEPQWRRRSRGRRRRRRAP